jgi:LPXTG-site transpeptidase (sortase) family protein
MRSPIALLALLLVSLLLASCGAPEAAEQSVAIVDAAPSATTQPTATTAPPTATAEPTNTPEPTATTEPTAEPTAEPTLDPAIAADVNDEPHLDESAAPEHASLSVAAVQPAQPVRIQIPAIKLDYRPVSVGLDKNRVPIVPKHDVGWYNLSAMPGQGDNIVFWGHVLRFKATPKIPAPFARVKELKIGAEIILTTAKGEKARYKVTQTVQVTPDQVKYILPTGKEQVTLVSCIGDNVVAGGSVATKKYRLITIAEPVR